MDEALNSIRAILQNAAIQVGENNIPDYLQSSLEQWGTGTSGIELQLDEATPGKLNWKRLLRRYVGSCFTPQPDFKRPSRRFPKLVGIVPGRRRQVERPQIMVVIDTSASMTDALIQDINCELTRLAGSFRVTVVECDVEVNAVYPYRRLTSVHGRGGTDLRPPFEKDFIRKQRPDLIIYFTDGEGPAPARPPRIPVIWCLTPGGQQPVSWGRVIKMD